MAVTAFHTDRFGVSQVFWVGSCFHQR